MNPKLETLLHFECAECGLWFTISEEVWNRVIGPGDKVIYCPYCQTPFYVKREW